MTIQITKASDDEYYEEREISSFEDLRKIMHEFNAPLILWPYDDEPFRFAVQIYDDYIE